MAFAHRLSARSAALAATLDAGLPRLAIAWLVMATIGSGWRLAMAPRGDATVTEVFMRIAPYALVVAAPVMAMLGFERHLSTSAATPRRRPLSGGGHPPAADRAAAAYGVGGLLVSLLLGILLNVPLRLAEFLVAIPALQADAPTWFHALYRWMVIDTVLLTTCYALVFVAGLRRMWLFPRLLMATWGLDLAMQLAIGLSVANAGPLPQAVSTALVAMLTGNIRKVAISVAIWMPYLLLSKRVSTTYLRRIAR
jgi:hypothetical protein